MNKERKQMSDNSDVDAGWDGQQDKPANILQYHSKLVGVTFEGRQGIIKMLRGDEYLRTRREPENEYDPKAVAVDVLIAEEWHPIGFIAKDKNRDIAASMDAGNDVLIKIASITGGGKDAKGKEKAKGVNIALEYLKVDSKKEAAPVAKASEPVVERELTPKQKVLLALEELEASLGGESVTKQYTSRILGKTTTVTVKPGGHIGLPGYLSGSSFPKKFYREFDRDGAVQGIVDKYYGGESDQGKIKEAILAMWALNSEASTGYGTAIHAALENYDTYHKLGDRIKKVEKFKTKPDRVGPNKALSRNPFIKKIVEDFHEKFGGDYVRLSEQFVWLHDEKLCGSIDRIKVIDADKRIVRIQDFKTDGDIHEPTYQLTDSPFYKLTQGEHPKMGKELLDLHWLQLSFYAYILAKYGYTVEGLDVYWLNPGKLCKGENAWEEFSHDVIDISKGLQ